MAFALETLVKILRLERDQKCKNKAVIGGLSSFSEGWKEKAISQARRPEQYILAIEVADVLRDYDTVEEEDERVRRVSYLLDRLHFRQPMPPEYESYMAEAEAAVDANKAASTKGDSQRSEARNSDRSSDRDQRSRSQERQSRSETRSDRGQQGDAQPQKEHSVATRESRSNDRASGQESSSYESDEPAVTATEGLDIPTLPRLARPPRKPRKNLSYEEAAARLKEMDESVTHVKGIGDGKASVLQKLGIHTIRDMLYYLPRRYDDYTQLNYISHLQPGEVATVIGAVTSKQVRVAAGGRKDFFMVVEDGSGRLNVTFFGQDFLIRSIRQGQQLVLSGKVTAYRNALQMTNPEWEALDSENLHTIGIVPVYPLTEGVKARSFRRDMKRAVDAWAERVPDYVPETTLERAELGDLSWALENIHFPAGFDHLDHARRRLVFDELLMLQLAILRNRRDWQSVPGQALEVTDDFLEGFINTVFPYELTGAQRRAVEDIRRDVTQPVPMNRLIQGDVGSGKTAVATVAMAMAVANGKQAALMAPTSILAEQHYRGIGRTLEQMPGEQKPVVALLTSSLTTSERESVYRGLADGSIDVVIGTHALIQSGVEFSDLAIAVIDEQHRFGVGQRGALRGKGTNPHMLVMTATPIPRTLALTMYADLDLSIIDEKPPGRQPIQTKVLYPVARERTYQFIEQQIEQGRQAFVVHPLVEASDKIEARSAMEAYDELRQVFYKYRVCLLHGRMQPAEKDDVMAAFANHEYDVMVTTSVAEVGVDVPNASVILIEGANRFGLAQLHQFRGRVGRGEHPSFCLLIADNETPESQQRLAAMEETNDGFRLAEIDWQQRGAGDLLGTRQSGQQTLQMAEAMTPDLVALAQREARTIYEEDPYLEQEEHRLLSQEINLLHPDDADLS
ncbi:ATP-dependent DNA helicase RecG [Phototrophicus methaneseepsis]|uniref:ATP-dependent DNA helicase RecG n=1 Tax=Phototrophicus methaneseepsis TaxID=2710758 RepID=A0A7S8ICJ4_9CHLR|nr:ATP-dependent DNA helicase RecG [Phototrophicus methaneseepsis]QPC80551.1 ATP-dependent DNA helicase RecG [Phototrophicus methaneseepsis]